MKGQETLRAEFEIVTTVFCAGADQNGPSEIRPFSIRGALRWWYRAIDGNFLEKEPKIFGSTTGTGQSSPITLAMARWIQEDASLEKILRPEKARESGAAYLGYTLYLGSNHRKAVLPSNHRITITLKWNWKPASEEEQQYIRRAWAAALWLFGHLGGLGTRARRGFGTLSLVKWNGWPECDLLGTAHGASTPAEWKARFDGGFQMIRQWFRPPNQAGHQHLGEKVPVYLWKTGKPTCHAALDEIGSTFQSFRNQPQWHKPELLAAFGLPIRFRNHPARRASPKDHNRAASPLQIRVVKIGNAFHPLVWRAEGPLVPEKQIKLVYGGDYSRQPGQPWDRALTAFLESIRAQCVA